MWSLLRLYSFIVLLMVLGMSGRGNGDSRRGNSQVKKEKVSVSQDTHQPQIQKFKVHEIYEQYYP